MEAEQLFIKQQNQQLVLMQVTYGLILAQLLNFMYTLESNGYLLLVVLTQVLFQLILQPTVQMQYLILMQVMAL